MTPEGILKRNNVTILGQGPKTLLFAHGFGCDQNMWRFVTPAFADDYRLVLFDYVGAGKSDRAAYSADRYSTLHGYAQDVLDVCAALELTDAIFVGHSVSGMIGLLASLQEPSHFSRLVMVSPSPCYLNDPPDYFGGFERAEIEGLLDLMDKNDPLASGDALAIFTDGLTEVGETRRAMLGIEGVAALFRAPVSGPKPQSGAEAAESLSLIAGVDAAAKTGIRDDVCLLVAVAE